MRVSIDVSVRVSSSERIRPKPQLGSEEVVLHLCIGFMKITSASYKRASPYTSAQSKFSSKAFLP